MVEELSPLPTPRFGMCPMYAMVMPAPRDDGIWVSGGVNANGCRMPPVFQPYKIVEEVKDIPIVNNETPEPVKESKVVEVETKKSPLLIIIIIIILYLLFKR